MAELIPLRPLDFALDSDAAAEEMAHHMMAPVLQLANQLCTKFESEGMPAHRKMTVTVRLSDQLREAMQAEGAFDLVVEWG